MLVQLMKCDCVEGLKITLFANVTDVTLLVPMGLGGSTK